MGEEPKNWEMGRERSRGKEGPENEGIEEKKKRLKEEGKNNIRLQRVSQGLELKRSGGQIKQKLKKNKTNTVESR